MAAAVEPRAFAGAMWFFCDAIQRDTRTRLSPYLLTLSERLQFSFSLSLSLSDAALPRDRASESVLPLPLHRVAARCCVERKIERNIPFASSQHAAEWSMSSVDAPFNFPLFVA